MAQILTIAANQAEFDTIVTKALQSGHINFLLGSGASSPAITTAGTIEADLNALLQDDIDGFNVKKLEFLSQIQTSTNDLISGTENQLNVATLSDYRQFLTNLSRILDGRKTELLPKQVTIFTTNYDLFIEHACEDMPTLRLNDGFVRNPAVRASYTFQPEHYFDVTFKTGTLFRYRFPIPMVNLIKLHGSLSWRLIDDNLSYYVDERALPEQGDNEKDIADFCDSFSLILPTHEKFHQTLLTRVYYNLLRIFANALEIENATLVCFGFSFNDEHILDIVTRALKNPTLLVLIVSYDEASVAAYQEKFKRHNNVLIFSPEGAEKINFSRLNTLLATIAPKS